MRGQFRAGSFFWLDILPATMRRARDLCANWDWKVPRDDGAQNRRIRAAALRLPITDNRRRCAEKCGLNGLVSGTSGTAPYQPAGAASIITPLAAEPIPNADASIPRVPTPPLRRDPMCRRHLCRGGREFEFGDIMSLYRSAPTRPGLGPVGIGKRQKAGRQEW